MIHPSHGVQIFVATKPVDFRKGHDGLAALVQSHLKKKPFDGIAHDVTCGCGAERHIIGEDVSERMDIVPDQFRVIVTRRPKYACRSCKAGIVQPPTKPRLIEGGMPTEATIASVIV